MPRSILYALSLLMLPASAHAIHLEWASGATSLAFTTSTRCTLLVEAEPQDLSLPTEWHLLWVSNHCPSIVAEIDTLFNESGLASVNATHYESAVEKRAGVATAGFRNAGTALVTSARYVFTLPGGSSGKFQAIARAPSAGFGTNESMTRSNVITFNGGASASFPPVIAHANAMAEVSGVTIVIAGAGLGRITRARIVRADAQPALELEIAQLSDSTLVAYSSHSVAQDEGVVELSDGAGGTGAAALAPAATCETAQPSSTFFNWGFRLWCG